MTAYATRDEIIDAINRANMVEHFDERGDSIGFWPENTDGTYAIIPSWVGNQRVFMAHRIFETEGFEVAFSPVLDGSNLNMVEAGDRYGMWTSPQGEICLDRTVHIRGAAGGVALDLGRLYKQDAIYDWAHNLCITTTDPATAL